MLCILESVCPSYGRSVGQSIFSLMRCGGGGGGEGYASPYRLVLLGVYVVLR